MTEPEPDYTLVIPNTAGWLNSNDKVGGKLYYRRAPVIAQWRKAGKDYAELEGVPRLERAHIVAELCFRDARRRDPNNFYPSVKAAVDGLVDAGVLVDDSHQYLVGPDMRIGPIVRQSRGRLLLHIYRLPAEPAP